uniref:Uncharacterized protein n=1 Tax=Ditylenchus dipsaci TaxID=166011 RepID=A0A915E537_9BILA
MYNRQCKRLFDKIYVVGYGRLFFASNDYSYRLNNLPVEYYEKKEKAQDQEWQEEMKNVNLRFKSDIKELLQKFSKKQSDFKLNQYDTDDIYLTLLITTDGDLQELDEVQREIWAVIENFVPSEEHQFDAKSSSDEDDRSSNEIRQDEIRGEEERRYNHDWLSIMTEEEFAQRFEKL